MKQWIPRRQYKYGKDKMVWESPNRSLWLSVGGYGMPFHLNIGQWSVMKVSKVKR